MVQPTRNLKKVTIALLLGMMLAPSNAFAAEPTEKKIKIKFTNVELSDGDMLVGQAINKTGQGIPLLPVRLQLRDKEVASTTDKAGTFRLSVKPGTTCLIRLGKDVYPCRAWKKGTAPPNAVRKIALLHDDSSVVRGNIFQRQNHANNCNCNECCGNARASGKKYGLAILALGAGAAYAAISRESSD